MKITLTPEECEEHFFNALCTIASGYMNGYGLAFDADDMDQYRDAKHKLQAAGKKYVCREDIWMQVLRDGGKLVCEDQENNGAYTRKITLQDVHDRLANTPTEHLMDAISGIGDATTDDVILQTVFFNEVIFG